MELSNLDSIAVISFAEQPEYPRLSRDILRELREHLHAVRSSGLFRAVVIAANSRSYAIGAQIEELSELNGITAFQFARGDQRLFVEIERSLLPVVAAIRGFAALIWRWPVTAAWLPTIRASGIRRGPLAS